MHLQQIVEDRDDVVALVGHDLRLQVRALHIAQQIPSSQILLHHELRPGFVSQGLLDRARGEEAHEPALANGWGGFNTLTVGYDACRALRIIGQEQCERIGQRISSVFLARVTNN